MPLEVARAALEGTPGGRILSASLGTRRQDNKQQYKSRAHSPIVTESAFEWSAPFTAGLVVVSGISSTGKGN